MTRWAVIALVLASAWAAAPVGTLVSVAPVTINGTKVAIPSVFFWPVLAGDEIATTASTGTLVLSDRSRIVLDRGATVRVEGSAVTLERGRVGYSLAPHSRVVIAASTRRFDVAAPTGILTLSGTKLTVVPGTMSFALSAPDPAPRDLPDYGPYRPAQ